MSLSHSLWLCHRARPLESNHVFENQYIAVIPEELCIIPIFTAAYDGLKNPIRVDSYAVWYEEIDEYELKISLVRRTGAQWKTAYYREYDDFLQWHEPKPEQDFNMFQSKVPWDSLSEAYQDSLNTTLERSRSIRQYLESK